MNHHTFMLDGDNVRQDFNKDLGFNEVDRVENIRRIGEVGLIDDRCRSYSYCCFYFAIPI